MSNPTSARDVLLAGLDDNLVLTLGDAAKLLPGRRPGKRMNARVLVRWAVSGVRGHRLRTLRIGQRHVVRIADLRDHLRAIAPGADRAAPRPSEAAMVRRRAQRAALAKRLAERALR